MTIRHLKVFIAVCETGTTTAAGEKLFIAQPSISATISELERHYGVQLFDRISNHLHITERGKQFLEYATHIVGLFDEMEQAMKNADGGGAIRIGASVTIGNCLLPQYMADFGEAHPETEVKVVIDNSETIQRLLAENNIDIGLIEGLPHNPNILHTQFPGDELVLVCGLMHPYNRRRDIAPAALVAETFILREIGSAGREFFDHAMVSYGIKIEPAYESSSTQAILRSVQMGLGISVLPYLLAQDSLNRGEVGQFWLQDIDFHRNFSIIYHKNKFLSAAAKDFMSHCK